MGNNYFVSYKFADDTVFPVNGRPATARAYVNDLVTTLEDGTTHVFRGEADGIDLSEFQDETIWNTLKERIFNTTLTIVLISPRFKTHEPESQQWIPAEVQFSLRNDKRNGIVSSSNALLGVVLPDRANTYSYVLNENMCSCGFRVTKINIDRLFKIMASNTFNHKQPEYHSCVQTQPDNVFVGEPSYMPIVPWNAFIHNHKDYIDRALTIRDNIAQYNISKQI
jgi:hypothetical protein